MQPTRNLHSYLDTLSRGWPSFVDVPLSVALFSASVGAMSLAPASAQLATTSPQSTTAAPEAIKQREQELEAARIQQKSAAESQAKFKADIAAIGQDRSKLNAQ